MTPSEEDGEAVASRSSPYRIVLSSQERDELEARARRSTPSYSQVVRAKTVWMAAEGLRNDQIAARLDTPRQVVSKWRKRFYEQRLAGLDDVPRVGRPPVFPPDVVVWIKALACELPATSGRPLSRRQCPDLVRAAVEQGIVASILRSTIWRWLSADAIQPWQYRSWSFPRDPDFAVNAGRVLDLYACRWQDKPLKADEYMITTDEKASIPARCRCHPTVPPESFHSMHVEYRTGVGTVGTSVSRTRCATANSGCRGARPPWRAAGQDLGLGIGSSSGRRVTPRATVHGLPTVRVAETASDWHRHR